MFLPKAKKQGMNAYKPLIKTLMLIFISNLNQPFIVVSMKQTAIYMNYADYHIPSTNHLV